MRIASVSVQRASARWLQNSARAVTKALAHPRDQKQYDWALSFYTGTIHKLSPGVGQGIHFHLSGHQAVLCGLKRGMRIAIIPLPNGGGVFRPVGHQLSSEELELLRQAADRHFHYMATGPQLQHYERICQRCHRLYCGTSARQRFCPACRVKRQRKAQRAYWQRKGKLTPSYQRKLTPRAPSGEIPAPAVA